MGTREDAMNKIEQIIDATVKKEGGYTNNPNDSGGETMWGITAAVAREVGYTGPMKAMTRDQAVAIYTAKYFLAPGFDKVLALSPSIAEELFDTGVNMHPTTAVRMLQRALNWFNKRGEHYPDLIDDGVLGPTTLKALKAYLELRKAQGELVLLRALNALQGVRYGELSERRQKDEDFMFGWFLHRVGI